jgi:arylsulfatase A-like enzyme
VVIMVGIDSLRVDVMDDPRREADLPELFRLRRESTYFAGARSPGSSTAPAMAAIFSGLYYSQLYWRLVPGAGPDVYPDQDNTPRFPELLDTAGVPTVTVDAVGFLLNRFGIVRGFREEQTLCKGGHYAGSQEMMDAALARLERHTSGPLFLFLHLIDAHAPYNRAGKRATEFESYVAELGLVDRQLGRLRHTIERLPFANRTMLVVFSDHGEAFGEHGTTFHGLTLYDELLRVPLMIRTGGAPREESAPVSLIDLGPTILDLMGVATPGRFMGQSLVPYLRGEHPQLHRPLIAEARLMRSLVTPEGMKIIHDTRAETAEVFDLRRDPREENNLYGKNGDDLLGVVRAFFYVHTLRRFGYEVPYRKW